MRKIFTLTIAFCSLAMFATAQTTWPTNVIKVAPDQGINIGALGNAIKAGGSAVYELQRGGIYYTNGQYSLPTGTPIVIRAEAGTGPRPMIMYGTPSAGGNQSDNVVRVTSETRLENLCITGYDDMGVIHKNTLRVNSGTYFEFDGCLFDYDAAAFIRNETDNATYVITNCTFRNFVDYAGVANGRGFDFRDTHKGMRLIMKNNTFYCISQRVLRPSTSDIDEITFENNTVYNVMDDALTLGYAKKVSVKNNLFYNVGLTGGSTPSTALISIDSLATPADEPNRSFVISNNVFSRDADYNALTAPADTVRYIRTYILNTTGYNHMAAGTMQISDTIKDVPVTFVNPPATIMPYVKAIWANSFPQGFTPTNDQKITRTEDPNGFPGDPEPPLTPFDFTYSVAGPKTWEITTADGGTAVGTFYHAFRYDALDGDIITFNIPGTDEIILNQVLERREDMKGTTITINGINKATGNPITISGENINTSIYRSRSNDASPVNINFNNMVFYKGNNPGNPGGAFGLGHSSHTQVSYVKFKDCTFTECEASGNGGAMNAGQGTALTLENCTFMNNKSGSEGGALSIGHSSTDPDNSAVIINCTFYNNEAATDGGALRSGPNTNTAERIINCTFVGNKVTGTAPIGGGVIAVGGSATYLVNCIIAGNTADDDVSGANINLQNCIVGVKNANVVNETNPVTFDKSIFAKGVAELKDNGGPTQTIAISNDGNAFKAGIATLAGFDIPTADQRGVARLAPPCIGAFDAPTESGKTGIALVASQSFIALVVGNQIKIISENAGWATVYDLTGNTVEKTYVTGNTALPAVLATGVYLVRLAEDNGNVSTAKVLVK